VIKGFGAEGVQQAKLQTEADDIRRESMKAAYIRSRFLPAIDLLPSLGLVAVLGLGGHRVITGDMTLGGAEWAVVHDAARVLTTAGLIERVMAGAKRSGAAAAARKMSDTVREADGQGNVVRLLDRDGLWRMETPQVVRGTILRQGLQKARAEGKMVTDCMAAAELAGVKGILVEATEPNLKITLPSDWQLAEVWLKAGSK
jgi:2-C-methyl-D-erythritol 4-phosphate cytidylyltransferase